MFYQLLLICLKQLDSKVSLKDSDSLSRLKWLQILSSMSLFLIYRFLAIIVLPHNDSFTISQNIEDKIGYIFWAMIAW